MARLFVAVYPPPAVVDDLAQLPRPASAGVRWVPADQLHVTMRFLGSADPDAVGDALDATMAGARRAVARVGPVVSRLGRSIVCVPVAGLDELAGVIAAATARVGDPPDPRPFRGHITLARLKSRAACGLAGVPFAAEFPVDAVHLVESLTRPEGAEHRRRRSWQLAA